MIIIQRVKTILHNEKGQGMVEYGLILALVAVVAIVGMTAVGTDISAKLGEIAAAL